MTAGPRQIAASSAWLLAENVVRVGAIAAISFVIARQLGPGRFGILNFASAFAAILSSIALMGMDAPVMWRLTRDSRTGAILGSALAIRALSGGVAFIIAVVLAWLLKRGDSLSLQATLITSTSLLLGAPAVLDFWFKARTRAIAPALARIVATLLAVAVKFACVMLGLGVIALAWTVPLEMALTSLGLALVYFLAVRRRPERLGVQRDLMRSLSRESLPYLYSAIAILLYMKVDVVMLSALAGDAETGIYSLAQKLSEVLYVVPTVLIESAYPALARRSIGAVTAEADGAQSLFDLALGGALIATIVAMLVAGPLIVGLFGESYRPSVRIFHVHAWSSLAIALNSARHRWLINVGLQRLAPHVAIVGVLVNVAMNFVLIPRLGGMGAAVATVGSYFVSGYLTSFLHRPLRDIAIMQTRSFWPWRRLIRSWHPGHPG